MNTGEETLVQNVPSTKSPSTVRALSSFVDLICEHFDHETKGFIETDIAVLKEILAKIEVLVKETEALSLRNRSFGQVKEENEGKNENVTQPTFPTPPLRGPASDALSRTVEKERADGDDSSCSKMKKNQIQKTEESRLEGDEHKRKKTVKTDESEVFVDYPHKRRSRKLSQPFLSPLPDLTILSPEVRYTTV